MTEESVPYEKVTFNLSVEELKELNRAWRLNPDYHSKSDFVRQAVKEKLKSEKAI